jgi:uncharacterized protein (DUF1684 family)
MSELESFRAEKNEFYKTQEQSPLTTEQKASFAGLKYFPENPKLVFDLTIDKNTGSNEIVSIQTSADDTEPYKRYGKIRFQVDGSETQLTVFQGLDDGHLFLPFKDATNGKETYGSGRYVEIEEENGKLKVDFNYAYNPNCAYNENWRCPLTPPENSLKVPIQAGEKKFHQ